MATQEKAHNNTVKASLWMSGTLLSFGLMAIAVRELSTDMDTIPMLFYRAVLSLLMLLALCPFVGWRQLRTSQWQLHVVRNATHFVGQYAWFMALAILPLATVFAIEFTTPAWTTLLAAILLKEKLTATRILAIICGLSGVYIIVQPSSIDVPAVAFIMLIGAIAYAFVNIQTKQLANHDSGFCIIFYMAVVQLLLTFVLMLDNWVWPDIAALPWLSVIALTALLAHYCISKALLIGDASVVAPIDFLRLPLIAIVGYLLYDESINLALCIGTAVMFLGIIANIYSEKRQENA